MLVVLQYCMGQRYSITLQTLFYKQQIYYFLYATESTFLRGCVIYFQLLRYLFLQHTSPPQRGRKCDIILLMVVSFSMDRLKSAEIYGARTQYTRYQVHTLLISINGTHTSVHTTHFLYMARLVPVHILPVKFIGNW